MTTGVEVTNSEQIQLLRLARPEKKNALTEAMYGALADALETGDAVETVRVHVLLGAGGVFTAGNDINDFLANAMASGGKGRNVLRFIRKLPRLEKPLIAGVDGPAVGIGTTMLFHCDLVYATPAATFSTPFVDLGLVPEAASSLLMPARLGYARAFEMLVMGAVMGAEPMREAGLVNAILQAADLEAGVMKAAQALAKKPREALAATRRLMRGDPAEIERRIEAEAGEFAARLASPEARAAFLAFLSRKSGGKGGQ
jgi:enoyl-CoA hydratase/carnithine racemase